MINYIEITLIMNLQNYKLTVSTEQQRIRESFLKATVPYNYINYGKLLVLEFMWVVLL